MKKITKFLTLCLLSLALLCTAVPAAFAASDTESAEGGVYAIGLDAAGGTSSTVVVYTSLAGKLTALPESPTMEGYVFQGWYTEPVGGTKVSTSTVFAGDTTIYAHWTVRETASSGSTAASGSTTTTTQPTMPSIKEHLGTILVAGILLTTIVVGAVSAM